MLEGRFAPPFFFDVHIGSKNVQRRHCASHRRKLDVAHDMGDKQPAFNKQAVFVHRSISRTGKQLWLRPKSECTLVGIPVPTAKQARLKDQTMKIIKTGFVVTGILLSLTACDGSVSYDMAMCPEPVKISDCKTERRKTFCTVESIAQVPITTYIDAWSYDKDGMSLENGMLDTIDLYPGQKKKSELILRDNGGIAKVIICSVNPSHPLAAARITPIK